MRKKKKNVVTRLTLDAAFMALYVLLGMFAVSFAGLKVTFEHFPVLLCVILYGPIDAMIVGGVGELLNQLMTFGLTPTTVLWILPILMRASVVGVSVKAFRKRMSITAIVKKKIPLTLLAVYVISGAVGTCFNTFAFFVDSKLMGYYNYVLVFGQFGIRIALSILTSVMMWIFTKSILHALKSAKLV